MEQMEDFQPVGRSVKGNGFPPKTSVLMIKYRQFIESLPLGRKAEKFPNHGKFCPNIFTADIFAVLLCCFKETVLVKIHGFSFKVEIEALHFHQPKPLLSLISAT